MVNTSFVERLNLTIRQGCSYLSRRSAGHARCAEPLDDHLGLLQCHYNFIRPHRSLQLGDQRRTPAWQAGLISRQLTFREIFLHPLARFVLLVLSAVRGSGRMRRSGLATTLDEAPDFGGRRDNEDPQRDRAVSGMSERVAPTVREHP